MGIVDDYEPCWVFVIFFLLFLLSLIFLPVIVVSCLQFVFVKASASGGSGGLLQD
jgi:hypothetical protein